MIKRRTTRALAGLAVAAGVLLLPAGQAGAVDYTNACRNSVQTTNWDQVGVSLNGAVPASVAPNGALTLSGLQGTLAVPGTIFVAGYNLGLLTAGPNTIPATVHAVIDAANTAQRSQPTNDVDTSISTTITDPDGMSGTGDETATPGTTSATFADQAWTAGPSGTIAFHEHDDTGITGVAGGGLVAVARLAGGVITVQFHCTSGSVTGMSPGVPTFSNAPTFATTQITTAAGGTKAACAKLRKALKKAKKAHNKKKVKKLRKKLRRLGC